MDIAKTQADVDFAVGKEAALVKRQEALAGALARLAAEADAARQGERDCEAGIRDAQATIAKLRTERDSSLAQCSALEAQLQAAQVNVDANRAKAPRPPAPPPRQSPAETTARVEPGAAGSHAAGTEPYYGAIPRPRPAAIQGMPAPCPPEAGPRPMGRQPPPGQAYTSAAGRGVSVGPPPFGLRPNATAGMHGPPRAAALGSASHTATGAPSRTSAAGGTGSGDGGEYYYLPDSFFDDVDLTALPL